MRTVLQNDLSYLAYSRLVGHVVIFTHDLACIAGKSNGKDITVSRRIVT